MGLLELFIAFLLGTMTGMFVMALVRVNEE